MLLVGFSLTSFARSFRSGLTQSLASCSAFFYKSFLWRLDAIASGQWLSRAYLCLWQRRHYGRMLAHFVRSFLSYWAYAKPRKLLGFFLQIFFMAPRRYRVRPMAITRLLMPLATPRIIAIACTSCRRHKFTA